MDDHHRGIEIHHGARATDRLTTETDATTPRIGRGGTTGATTTRIDGIGIGGTRIVTGGIRVSGPRLPVIRRRVFHRRRFCLLRIRFPCQEQFWEFLNILQPWFTPLVNPWWLALPLYLQVNM